MATNTSSNLPDQWSIYTFVIVFVLVIIFCLLGIFIGLTIAKRRKINRPEPQEPIVQYDSGRNGGNVRQPEENARVREEPVHFKSLFDYFSRSSKGSNSEHIYESVEDDE
jgi:hypothetical protein